MAQRKKANEENGTVSYGFFLWPDETVQMVVSHYQQDKPVGYEIVLVGGKHGAYATTMYVRTLKQYVPYGGDSKAWFDEVCRIMERTEYQLIWTGSPAALQWRLKTQEERIQGLLD